MNIRLGNLTVDIKMLNAMMPPPDERSRERAHGRWSRCAHPLGSLGILEGVVEDIAALTGDDHVVVSPRDLLVFCADNGVVAQGVAQSTAEVTRAVTRSLAEGHSSVCAMARVAECKVIPVDMGVRGLGAVDGLLDRRLGDGTADISQGPAMTRDQALAGIETGISLVRERKAVGTNLLAVGEMGIGNTTTTSALVCSLLGLPAGEMCGRGAGLDDEGLRRKKTVVKQALAVNCPDPSDPIDCLAKVGGFDLAGLVGVCLGGALFQVPVMLDGVITLAAAHVAVRLAPACRNALIASHVSAEPASQVLVRALGLRPFIDAGMRLGEGTGAVAALPLLDMALTLYNEGATFDAYGIEAYRPWGDES